MVTVGKYLVAFLRAGKCRDVATNAALRAVYANFNHSAVFEFVRMSCLFESFLRVIVYAEFKRFFASDKRESVLASHFEPAGVGVVSVLLRDEIVVLEIRNFARIHAEFCRSFAVAVVFVRSSCEEGHIVGGRKPHTEAVSGKREHIVFHSH